jgi:hypothetical protein
MSDGMTICACGHRRGMHAINGSHCYDVESGDPHTACPCATFRVPPERPERAALRALVEAAEDMLVWLETELLDADTDRRRERLEADLVRYRAAIAAARSALPVDEKEDRR